MPFPFLLAGEALATVSTVVHKMVANTDTEWEDFGNYTEVFGPEEKTSTEVVLLRF